MTHQEIRQHFGVDPNSSVSLREQLENRISEFLDDAPEGMSLPAERLLSEVLGISRVTVRSALARHYSSGRIIRQRRRGTLVAPKEKPNRAINELALGLPWKMTASVKTIRFLSYETLPHQQRFWREVISCFEHRNPAYKVELVSVNSLPGGHSFKDYLKSEDIDVFIHSHVFGVPSPEIAATLPANLHALLCQDEILDVGVRETKPEDFRLFPFHLDWCDTFWNQELGRSCGLSKIGPRLWRGEKMEMICEVLDKLPEGGYGGSHAWCQLAHHGLPGMLQDPDALTRHLETFAAFGGKGNSFLTSQVNPLDDVEQFVAGEVLFLDAYTSQLHTIGMPSFEVGRIPCNLLGGLRFCHCQDLAVTPNCCDMEVATAFLAFLLTPEVQTLVWKIKEVAPVRRPEYQAAMKALYGFKASDARDFEQKMYVFRNPDGKVEREIEFLLYDVRDELSRLLAGEASVADTAERIRRKWKRKYGD